MRLIVDKFYYAFSIPGDYTICVMRECWKKGRRDVTKQKQIREYIESHQEVHYAE